jgi:uncharacterized membrane protein YgcG
MIPAVLPTAAENLPAFIENVVRFPLGLAGVQSPAASPLIGHVVVSLFPGIHRLFTAAVAGVGILVLGYVLVRHRPTSPAALSRLVGWIMAVAILLAPATRVGYLLYPIDFFVWAWLLRGEDSVEPVTALEPVADTARSDRWGSGDGDGASGDGAAGDGDGAGPGGGGGGGGGGESGRDGDRDRVPVPIGPGRSRLAPVTGSAPG